jgi:hypothetical protein
LTALLALTGCQLAIEDAGTEAAEDKLVGVFITTEPLDLFDTEAYLSDILSDFSGGELPPISDNSNYQGRLYAELTPRTDTNEETGEIIETEEYVFPVEGFAFFATTVPGNKAEDSYTASTIDPAIGDGHLGVNVSDEGKIVTLTGTLYTTPQELPVTYYYNPVYQSADGSVYVVSGGGGFMVNTEAYSEGEVYSQSFDATTTTTENGVTRTDSCSVTVSINVMFAPEKIVVLQMSESNAVLSREEYEPGALPENLSPERNAAYLLVETHKRNEAGEIVVSREVYSHDAQRFETFSPRPDGVCVKSWTAINWAG